MKMLACLAGTAVLMLAVGCVPSVNPVYTDNELVFDEALVGTWVLETSPGTWVFAKRDPSSYQIVYSDKDGKQCRLVGRLAKIQGTLFLDICPEAMDIEANALYKFHLAPIHTIYLVVRTGPTPQLAAMNHKWLEQYLDEHPDEIAAATVNGRKLITASTKDLQAFVLRHKEAFTGELIAKRIH